MMKETQPGKDNLKKDGSARNYGLIMDRRDHISLTGVNDVMSFDEMTVVLKTEGGEVTINGQNLHVARLMLEEGQLVIDGNIDAIEYQDAKPQKKSARVMKRIFR